MMSKRKLSEKQRARIQANQTASLAEPNTDTTRGLVIARYGAQALVQVDINITLQCTIRPNCPDIVIGDNVQIFSQTVGKSTIGALLPRKNFISRIAYNKKEKLLASNIDTLCVILAPKPLPEKTTLDRYLIAASLAGIPTVIVINKQDLLSSPKDFPVDLTPYQKLSYPIYWISCLNQTLNGFTSHLKGHVLLVGQSGVGKSSLINAIIPDMPAQTGHLSHRTGLGQHTTSTAYCYALPNQAGFIMDSPGIRQFIPQFSDAETLCKGFIEFIPYLGHCRFRDCLHRAEPECAIKKAVQTGHIAMQRYENYLYFLTEISVS